MVNFQKVKPKYQYAVVMVSRGIGLHPGMNAVINSLDEHDNEVDLYLIHGPDELPYLEKVKAVKDLKVNVIPVHIDECRELWPDYKRDEGWQNFFFRWKMMAEAGKKYRSVMMLDSDMFCCNNIMKYFEIAADSRFILLPSNPWGSSVDVCKERWDAIIREGASSPPYHSMPAFFNANKNQDLIEKIWERGKTEPFDDIQILSRVIFSEKMWDRILILPNILWVHTSWYYDLVGRYHSEGKTYFKSMEENINFVHRRWWMTDVCQQFLDRIDKVRCPVCYINGVHNVKLFWEEYKRLNQTLKIRLDYDFKFAKGH